MSKIDISVLPDILTEQGIPNDKQEKILEQIQEIIKAEKEEKEESKLPRQKSQLGVILLDENNELKTDNISALIYEIPSSANHDDTIPNIKKAVVEFNNTKKGQKSPVKSISESFQAVKPKIFKQFNIKKKTKEPVRCLISSNKI